MEHFYLPGFFSRVMNFTNNSIIAAEGMMMAIRPNMALMRGSSIMFILLLGFGEFIAEMKK